MQTVAGDRQDVACADSLIILERAANHRRRHAAVEETPPVPHRPLGCVNDDVGPARVRQVAMDGERKGNAKMAGTGGDGVSVSIIHNGTSIYGPVTISGSDTTTGVTQDLVRTVAAGDSLFFIVDKYGTNHFDSTLWDPLITLYP